MRRMAAAAVLLALGGPAQGQAVAETAQSFSAAMQGCWNRTQWGPEIEAQRADPGYSISSQMCLSGGLEGVLTVLDCGGVNNLVECAQTDGRYEFREQKFWRDFGEGKQDNCDVQLERRSQVKLFNCQWVGAEASAGRIEDVLYERAVGQ